MAVILLVAACISDALDGFIARLFHQQTQLGRFLDPLADKLLILSGYLGLLFIPESLPYHPPIWITVTLVFRELILTLGLLVLFLTYGKIEIRPNILGKICTAFQMLTLCSILFKIQAAVPLSYITAALTILSCLVYMIRELKKLQGVS